LKNKLDNDGYKYASAIVFSIPVKARTFMKKVYLIEQYFVQK